MLNRLIIGAISACLVLAGPACAGPPEQAQPGSTAASSEQQQTDTYSQDEIVNAVANFFGVTAEAAGQAIERVFKDNGRPNAYIKGEEAGGAVVIGLRYGKGTLNTKRGETRTVYWQGPSVGWDWGANGAKVFTLVYNLPSGDYIYRRFPGVEGSAYFIGGIGVNYQREEDVTLAPMRAGVGFRLGANVGYLAYTRKRNILPF